MPAKIASLPASAAKNGSEKGDKKKRKKKKKTLNTAQSMRMNELQTRIYEASLLGKYINESERRDEYVTDVTEKDLGKELPVYADSLARQCGHIDLVKEFVSTKEWLAEEQWKDQSSEHQKAQYRTEQYGTEVDSNCSDADETSEEE